MFSDIKTKSVKWYEIVWSDRVLVLCLYSYEIHVSSIIQKKRMHV